MPYLAVTLSKQLNAETTQQLTKALSSATASLMGKPEQYVMVVVEANDIRMAGEAGAAAFIDVRSIGGLTPKTVGALCERLTAIVAKAADIAAARVYLNFTDVPAARWGWNGATFG